jgi:hypothetical protein
MRHLKILGVALVAMFAFGIMATAAFALPDVSVLPKENFPLHLNFTETGTKPTTSLRTTGGSQLKGEGLSVLLLWTELSALGTWAADFLKVKNGTTPCNTTGDAKEVVLVSGEVHVVPLPPKGSKEVGGLFLFKEFTIECEKVKVKVRGSAISSITDPKAEECVELLTGALVGDKKGKNTLTKYLNDNGEETEGILEANFGTGYLQASEEVGEAIHFSVLEKKMFLISGR